MQVKAILHKFLCYLGSFQNDSHGPNYQLHFLLMFDEMKEMKKEREKKNLKSLERFLILVLDSKDVFIQWLAINRPSGRVFTAMHK